MLAAGLVQWILDIVKTNLELFIYKGLIRAQVSHETGPLVEELRFFFFHPLLELDQFFWHLELLMQV